MAKIEDGNIRAAVRIICSDDALASDSPETRGTLIDKHPPVPTDCHIQPGVTDGSVPALQVDEGDVRRAIDSFPLGSSGGPDSLLPPHLKDLTGNDGDPDLLCSLTSFENKLLVGTLPAPIAKFFYGKTLIALNKKDGGIRPITIGYTLRCLAAKCANSAVIDRVTSILSPVPVGVGVKSRVEAAVHATRRYIDSIRDSPDRAIVKLDFKNAFSCMRRDCMLEAVLQWISELYAFCHNAYSGYPVIMFNDTVIESATGAQQGDPLGPLLFSITLHPILMGCTSEFRIGYLDDVTLCGLIQDVDGDVQRISQEACLIGLDLNPGKCQIISKIGEGDAESLTFVVS